MHKVDISDWKSFKIGDLFAITKGKRLRKADMKPGTTRFIGASSKNNGCTSYVGNDEPIHPGNTITVCYNGSVGTAFYQSEPFLASDDVNVLNPNFDMNERIALFLVPLIEIAGSRFDYIEKWGKEIMEESEIVLPVTASKKPDWNYIEQYAINVEMKAKQAIQVYAELI